MNTQAQHRTQGDPTKVIVGDTVGTVTAHHEILPAEVIGVRDGGTIDIKFVYLGEPMKITASPYDGTATQPDSWHLT